MNDYNMTILFVDHINRLIYKIISTEEDEQIGIYVSYARGSATNLVLPSWCFLVHFSFGVKTTPLSFVEDQYHRNRSTYPTSMYGVEKPANKSLCCSNHLSLHVVCFLVFLLDNIIQMQICIIKTIEKKSKHMFFGGGEVSRRGGQATIGYRQIRWNSSQIRYEV